MTIDGGSPQEQLLERLRQVEEENAQLRARLSEKNEGLDEVRNRHARVILDEMYQFVALLDLEGNILEINRPALRGAGIKRENIVGRPFWEAHWWQVSEEINQRLQEAIKEAARGHFIRYEVPVFGAEAGKETIIIDFSINPVLDKNNNVIYLLPEGRNISERKAAEAEVARQQAELEGLYTKLKEMDVLKSQFFANISHELRTPLTLILGPLRKYLASASLAQQERRELETVERNAGLLLKHVNDLLDLSKLELGKMQLGYAQGDLAGLCRLAASYFEIMADEQEVDYRLIIPDNLPAQFDPEKILRVLLNLLSNAFKFTPRSGVIAVSSMLESENAVIFVEDSGPGVPQELREAIFERFRQIDGASNRKFGGTGLGLSIVREFVALHRGRIEVGESALGGAAFKLVLPLSAPSGVEVAAEKSTPDHDIGKQILDELQTYRKPVLRTDSELRLGTPLVLVVEGNPEMNQFIADTLYPHCRVASAFGGQEGLEKAKALEPDLILSDVMMPGMSGDEMVEALRNDSRFEGTPVVFLTAKADEELRVRMLKRGAQDFLSKPFSTEELIARVEMLLRERKRNEQDVRRGYQLLRAVTEGVDEAVYVKDLEGRYLMINTAGAKFLGRSVADVVGRNDRELFSFETAEKIIQTDQEILRSSVVRSYEEVGEAASDTKVYLSTKGPFVDSQGRLAGILGISRDITERKRSEEAVREADRRKDHFIATLAHELRNPLAPILTALHILELRITDEQARRALVIIKRQVRHMVRLVDDLLDVSRITSGKIRLQRETLNVRRLIDTILHDRMTSIRARELSLEIHAPERDIFIDGDPTRLSQIVENLIDNAVKFTEPGGIINVSVHSEPDAVFIIVRDSGVGINPELLKELFQPFAQADRTLDRSGGGLGLGLSIVEGLVALHGGTVKASSEGEGKGAEFTVRIPVQIGAQTGEPVDVSEKVELAPTRVLIIEDNRDAAEMLKELLSMSGHSVEVAYSGRAGVLMAKEFRPDVVLCDIGLPELDGFGVAKEIRRTPDTRTTRLIALTGYGRDEDREEASKAGFDAHLVKPIDFEKLLSEIDQVMS